MRLDSGLNPLFTMIVVNTIITGGGGRRGTEGGKLVWPKASVCLASC